MESGMSRKFRYLFGPVPSRRFGRSLGVDLTPYKTCSFDCIFCQLGRTPEKTVIRKEYVPTAAVLAELEEWLKTDGCADFITLSGSGEPTLHSGFGQIFEFVHKNSKIPTILLTNGSMLCHPEVRDAAALADVVKVSLSAWDQASYEWVNRPHADLRFDQLIKGQRAFRARFEGRFHMEVFLIKGVNAFPEDVEKIAGLAKTIAPDRIQLNTAVRPPAEVVAAPLSKTEMDALTGFFDPPAEVIAEFSTARLKDIQANEITIFSMLKRRPCTANQIGEVFGMHLNEVSKYLGKLIRTGKIQSTRRDEDVYYFVA
jgi:wyosine [tRNA(Phe)-imidazoG37] synthetase (radical SAM superfamily)